MLVASLSIMVFPTHTAKAEINQFKADLIAGGGNPKSAVDVGDVLVYNDSEHLYIKYVTADGWYLTKTHLHVATEEEAIPLAGSKGKGHGKEKDDEFRNPVPGQFEYTREYDECVAEDTYIINLGEEEAEPGDELTIAAHAVVRSDSKQESAWADGIRFTDKGNWATYFVYHYHVNQPPTASLNVLDSAAKKTDVWFDASGSSDPDGDTITFQWDFGDGNIASGEVVSYSYSATGTYVVTLEVSDEWELTNTISKSITINR